jgi:hypothetical protein
MTRIVTLRIQSNLARTQAIEWSRDGSLLGGAWIHSAWGLVSSREEHGDGYWYCPERLFSIDAQEGESGSASHGDDDDARAFNELTLVVLHAIYMQWSFVINELNSKTFELSLRSFCDFLQREGETRPHLLRWLGAYVEGAAEAREHDTPRSVEWFG